MQTRLVEQFTKSYGEQPEFLVRAPGRVNLIGEHTDYNDGFVLPVAIDRAVWIALRRSDDGAVTAYSIDFNQQISFSLGSFSKSQVSWLEYIKGVAWALQQAGWKPTGWQGVVAGDIPVGAGLSSSAALEVAAGAAFTAASEKPWDPVFIAKISQQAENDWVGMKCGIMDQLISAAGKAGQALFIDCRSLATETAPLPEGAAIVVMDTMTRRGLVDSAYNERRAQCEAAARYFEVPALRDVSLEVFHQKVDGLDVTTSRRAHHVISENERVLQAVQAMRQGDLPRLGALMNASHASLRDDFEVSSPALNTMAELAQAQTGCYGARMTGAGFGGCAVALVDQQLVEKFVAAVSLGYQDRTGRTPALYVCKITRGAEVFSM